MTFQIYRLRIYISDIPMTIPREGLINPVHLVSTLTSSASTLSLSSPDIFAMTNNLSLRDLYRSLTARRTSICDGRRIWTSSGGNVGSFNVETNCTERTRQGI